MSKTNNHGLQTMIEVVYALPHQQTVIELPIEPDFTVRQAILCSGILKKHPEIDLNKNQVGIWGQKIHLDHITSEGDRIEIYRSLIVDPKERRRQRAKNQ